MSPKRIWATLAGLTLGICAAVSTGMYRTAPGIVRAQTQHVPAGGVGADIPAPPEWVPFVADVRATDTIDGVSNVRMEGKHDRRSDGSTRLETGPPGGPIKVVSIRNVTANRYFSLLKEHW